LHYSGFLAPKTEKDSLDNPANPIQSREGQPARTSYGELKAGVSSVREDFRKQLPITDYSSSVPVLEHKSRNHQVTWFSLMQILLGSAA
jgi:hypothetical protein